MEDGNYIEEYLGLLYIVPMGSIRTCPSLLKPIQNLTSSAPVKHYNVGA